MPNRYIYPLITWLEIQTRPFHFEDRAEDKEDLEMEIQICEISTRRWRSRSAKFRLRDGDPDLRDFDSAMEIQICRIRLGDARLADADQEKVWLVRLTREDFEGFRVEMERR